MLFQLYLNFLSHPYTVNGKPYRVPTGIQQEIKYNFNELMKLKNQGINLFFTDVDKITLLMNQELKNQKSNC